MIEVLLHMFRQYARLESKPSQETIVRELMEAGFDEDAIESAMTWLIDMAIDHSVDESSEGLAARPIYQHIPPPTVALAATHLDAELLSYVDALCDHAGLSTRQRWLVLGRLYTLSQDAHMGRVDMHAARVIILMVLWASQQPLNALLVAELMGSETLKTKH